MKMQMSLVFEARDPMQVKSPYGTGLHLGCVSLFTSRKAYILLVHVTMNLGSTTD